MISEKLKKAREQAGFSQEYIAKMVGISQPAYCYIERGDKIPSLPVAKQLAKTLKITLDYLVGDED